MISKLFGIREKRKDELLDLRIENAMLRRKCNLLSHTVLRAYSKLCWTVNVDTSEEK